MYGQVAHYIASDRSCYVYTTGGKLRIFKLEPETDIYRWGQKANDALITGNNWVRVLLGPGGEGVLQVAVAESLPLENKTLAYFDQELQTLTAEDGDVYRFSPRTDITKDGFPVPARELKQGDKLEINCLAADGVREKIAVSIKTAGQTGEKPILKVSTVPLSESFWVVGNTDAEKLYLWGEQEMSKIIPTEGQFSFHFEPEKQGKTATLVGVGRNGVVSGLELDFAWKDSVFFDDLEGHWAGNDLIRIAGEGLISGYPNGKFRPDGPVTRAEFATMLARAFRWYSAGVSAPEFADSGRIPAWARESVAAAAARGMVVGFPDGKFKPQAYLTRQEECAILARIADSYGLEDIVPVAKKVDGLPFTDAQQISPWALSSVEKLYHVDIIKGRTVSSFMSLAPATRAETAVTVYRMLTIIRETKNATVVN